MSIDYETIIDFLPLVEADRKWKKWLEGNDISGLSSDDILVDVGRGEVNGKIQDIKRFRIRKDRIESVYVKSKNT